jgi:spore coat protein U-like protein
MTGLRLALAAFLALLLTSRPAQAVSCSVSATGLAFGTYQPLAGAANTSTATVTVTCFPGLLSIFVNYSVQLTAGSSNQVSNRAMSGPNGSLRYQIYRDIALTQPWGDGTAGTSFPSDGFVLGILFPVTTVFTAYGRVPAAQLVGPGVYTDTVVVVVSY